MTFSHSQNQQINLKTKIKVIQKTDLQFFSQGQNNNQLNHQETQYSQIRKQKQTDYELELLLRAHQRIRQLQQENKKCDQNIKRANTQIQQLNQKLREKNKSCELLKRLNEQLIQNLMTAQEQIKAFKSKKIQPQPKVQINSAIRNRLNQDQFENQCLQPSNSRRPQFQKQSMRKIGDIQQKLLATSQSTPNLGKRNSFSHQSNSFLKKQMQQFGKHALLIQNAQKQINDNFSFSRKTIHHSNEDYIGSIYNSRSISIKNNGAEKRSSSFVNQSKQQFQKNQKIIINRSPLIRKNRCSQTKTNGVNSNNSLSIFKQQDTFKSDIPNGLFKINMLNNAKSVNQLLNLQKKIAKKGSKLKLNGQKKQNSPHFVTHSRKASILQTQAYGLKYRNLYL